MNFVAIQILALGLTVSQVATLPPDQLRTEFQDTEADKAKIAALLGQGCHLMMDEVGKVLGNGLADKFPFDDFFKQSIQNVKAFQDKAKQKAEDDAEDEPPVPEDEKVTTLAPQPLPGKVDKVTSANLMHDMDVPTVYAAYRQFCKGEKVEDSPVNLSEVIAYYNEQMANLPDFHQLRGMKLQEPTQIFVRNGPTERYNLFTELYSDKNRRKWVSLQDVPKHLRDAFVAAEDKNFYQHKGFDLNGFARATYNSMAKHTEGGSTITQQVVKNILLNNDVTFERKMREMILAARIEQILSKNEILELYLNYIFLGRSSWGIEMAAQSYFGVSVKDMDPVKDLNKFTMLAALAKGPDSLNPDHHPVGKTNEKLQARRDYVLAELKKFLAQSKSPSDQLAEADYTAAVKAPTTVDFEKPIMRIGSYFMDEIERNAHKIAKIGHLTDKMYYVKATMQPNLQRVAEKALRKHLIAFENKHGGPVGAYKPEGSIAAEIHKTHDTWDDILPHVHGKYYDLELPLAVVIETAGAKVAKGQHRKSSGSVTVGMVEGDETVTYTLNADPNILRTLQLYDLVRIQKDDKTPNVATLFKPPTVQGATVVLEAKTGRVLALVGGFSYGKSPLNRATQSRHPPGSTIKPFLYLSALQLGFQPNTMVPGTPITFPALDGNPPWTPHNYERGRWYAHVTMQDALEQSLNVQAMHTMYNLGSTPAWGLDYFFNITKEMKIYTEMTIGKKPGRYFPFGLGVQPARLLDIALAYAAIDNSGSPCETDEQSAKLKNPCLLRPQAHFIDSITDQYGHVVYDRHDTPALMPVPSIDRVSFYQMRRIMEGTVARGTAMSINVGGDLKGFLAGKTGTSSNQRDAWFMCFTNDLVIGTWVGYDNNHIRASLGDGSTGAQVALPINEEILRASFTMYHPMERMTAPPVDVARNTVEYPIDIYNGNLMNGGVREIFRTLPGQPTVPVNTQWSLQRGPQISMAEPPTPLDGVDDDQTAFDPDVDPAAQVASDDKSADEDAEALNEQGYTPGDQDNYDSQQNVDPFLMRILAIGKEKP
jgi:penicillin-binding protein 1A